MPISPRRMLRWAAVVLVMIFAVVACWHDTAYAATASPTSRAILQLFL